MKSFFYELFSNKIGKAERKKSTWLWYNQHWTFSHLITLCTLKQKIFQFKFCWCFNQKCGMCWPSISYNSSVITLYGSFYFNGAWTKLSKIVSTKKSVFLSRVTDITCFLKKLHLKSIKTCSFNNVSIRLPLNETCISFITLSTIYYGELYIM